MKTTQDPFTRKDYERLPEGFPAELIEGQLVKEPAPTYGHGLVGARIRAVLHALVGAERVPDPPSDVGLDDLNVYQPDIVVLKTLPRLDRSDVGIPLIAVEVLSPPTESRDRDVKTRHLLAAGVAEVWLVDPRRGRISVHDGAAVRTAVASETIVSEALVGFRLVPADVFRPPGT